MNFQILQLEMNEYKYHYLLTSFDIESFDLEDFKYNFVNITSFRLVDVGDINVRNILKGMEDYNSEHNNNTIYYRELRTIKVRILQLKTLIKIQYNFVFLSTLDRTRLGIRFRICICDWFENIKTIAYFAYFQCVV